MRSYFKNILPSGVSVTSVITIFSAELSGSVPNRDSHDFWELVYVSRGIYNVRSGDSVYALSEGEVLIHAPNVPHEGAIASDALISVISFEGKGEELFSIANRPVSLSGEARRRLVEIMALADKNFSSIFDGSVRYMHLKPEADRHELKRLKAELEILLTELARRRIFDGMRKNAKNYKNSQFASLSAAFSENVGKNLSIDELAALISVSVPTLRALCSFGCGMSPTAYFISLKMDKAMELIRTSSMNFTEISDSLGFSSVHYFSKLFKEKIGMTPTEYACSLEK